ncbi:hypothetical protein [Sphingomonas sp.]|uniref:hypothetical protein n=1 Tax=Sphingomonas sp. TaxID=28214 RepID=UPI001D4D4269|nr:hypothetical protein [Sphingomonas sp.]MBX9796147.1 hypothetical protein [Sphingomonas sp.]
MLAGLLFANEDADDAPDALVATLPFGGTTLIEYQARLLIAAGAAHLLIVVARLTPELIGAINRIGRRGVAVDAVRSAAEATEKLHPLAEVMVLAGGLVTTESLLEAMAAVSGDTLMVTAEQDALLGLERVGHAAIWAGIARLGAGRVADVARLPRDYDVQSSLLRVAAQAGAAHLLLPAGPARAGHGVEHSQARLQALSEATLATLVSRRRPWADRYLVAPLARAVLPALLRRQIGTAAPVLVAMALIALALLLTGFGMAVAGLPLLFLAQVALAAGGALASMRDEERLAQLQRGLGEAGVLAAVLLIGARAWVDEGALSGPIAAAALALFASFASRAAPDPPRWFPSAPAYALLLLPFVAAGQALAGLLAAAGYAALALGAGIERLRKKA